MPEVSKKLKMWESKFGVETRHRKERKSSRKGESAENKVSLVSLNGTLFENGHANSQQYSDDKLSPDVLPSEIKNKLKSHQKDTGVYLFEHGYVPKKCLGAGTNGVVWVCKVMGKSEEIVVKVTCDSKMFGLIKVKASNEEILNSKVLKDIINGDEDSASKYLIIPKHDEQLDKNATKKRAFFTSELADKGDLEHYSSKKSDYARFIEILETGTNVLKGLKILHDAGYSHNDVKPDNLLAITEKSDTATKQADKSADQEHIVVKLADFGCITKIDSKLNQKLFANRYFCPPDMQNLREEAVAKRDVYSLGVVLLHLLLNCKKEKAKQWANKLEHSKNLNKFCDSKEVRFQLGNNLLIKYDSEFSPGRSEKMKAFLAVVQKMVASSYNHRLDVNTAWQYMRNVSNMSDGL